LTIRFRVSLTPVLKYLMIIAYSRTEIINDVNRRTINVPTIVLYIEIALAAVFGIALVAVIARALIEPYLLEIDRAKILLSPSIAGNEDSECRTLLRIAFFSDIHGAGCKVSARKLIDALFSEPADVILFGGDIADSVRTADIGLDLLRRIAERAARYGIPCFAVRGNHDLRVTRENIESTGFRLLVNQFSPLRGLSDSRFLLIGMDDSGKKHRVWPQLPDIERSGIPSGYRIVLAHNPDYIRTQENPDRYGIQLSGHLHGGQIILPFNMQFTVLRGDRLPREGIVQGLFSKNGISGYITRGVGCGVLPLRFLAKPQVSLIEVVG